MNWLLPISSFSLSSDCSDEGDGRIIEMRHCAKIRCIRMSFSLPGLHLWQFRIVLIGGQVILEANGEQGQSLSTILSPGSSRVRCGYELVRSPQCALIHNSSPF